VNKICRSSKEESLKFEHNPSQLFDSYIFHPSDPGLNKLLMPLINFDYWLSINIGYKPLQYLFTLQNY